MTTNIAELAVGRKTHIVGVLGRVDIRAYEKGNWFASVVEDNTGRVRIVGWNEAYAQFGQALQEGKTYRFFGVTPRRGRDGGVELTIYKDTRIDSSANIELKVASGSIASMLSSGLRRVDISKAIVFSVGEPRDNTRGKQTLRLTLIDASDTILDVMLVDDAVAPALSRANTALTVGDIVSCRGNLSDRKMLFVSEPMAKAAADPALTSWFVENDAQLAKRRRVDDISSLSAVADVPLGSRGEFLAIVKSCSMSPLVLSDGLCKLSFSVVDKTMAQVDVSFFDIPEGTSFAVGACVKFSATVVAYRGRSLSTRAVCELDATDETAALKEWWATAENAEFTIVGEAPVPAAPARMPASGPQQAAQWLKSDGGHLDFASTSADTP